jgi:D-alanyl-lipoteichoic acid acyltransferase DltB (MBOAT superfamily)
MAWHMSLLNWLRRFVFLPLLFNLSKTPRIVRISRDLPTILSLWILFLAVALWHAWTINYFFWGVSNAIGLTVLHLLKSRLNWKRPVLKIWKDSKIAYIFSMLVTLLFTIVTFGPLALSQQQFLLLLERVQISAGLIQCESPDTLLRSSSNGIVSGLSARCIYYQYSPTLPGEIK